jgi:predicted nucleic acid-binding protein
MGTYILDANVLMAILISGKSIYKKLLTEFIFITSDFALIEIEKYKTIIIEKSKLKNEEFTQYSYFVFSHIHVFPNYIIEQKIALKAIRLVEGIDIKDVAYVALSLQLELPILTRDLKLVSGLRKKGFKNISLFENFIRNI